MSKPKITQALAAKPTPRIEDLPPSARMASAPQQVLGSKPAAINPDTVLTTADLKKLA